MRSWRIACNSAARALVGYGAARLTHPTNRIVGYGNTGLRLMLSSAAVALLVSAIEQPISARAGAAGDLLRVAAVASAQAVDHSAWDGLLKTHVRPRSDGLNRVDYAALKSQGREILKAYVRGLEQIDHTRLDRPEQFAFLANLYNAKTIEIVADRYPVKSIKDISLGGDFIPGSQEGPGRPRC